MTKQQENWLEIGKEAARSGFASLTDVIFVLALAHCAVPVEMMVWVKRGWNATRYADERIMFDAKAN